MRVLNVSIIGAGHLSWHLGRTLVQHGHHVSQVYNRRRGPAAELAEAIMAQPIDDLDQLSPAVDLYLLAVSDTAIEDVGQKAAAALGGAPLLVHTSGATPISILEPFTSRAGVFWPLQTFTKDRTLPMVKTPFLCSASQEKDLELLLELGIDLSGHAQAVSDEQRLQLHLAAAFANNFTNHLLHICQQLLLEKGLDFSLLWPILETTLDKVYEMPALEAQSGPARRGDTPSIERHLQQLKAYPEWAAIYESISRSIQKTYS